MENLSPPNVLDVRKSKEERKQITEKLKDINYLKGSKFLKPSFSVDGNSYNKSYKPKKSEENE